MIETEVLSEIQRQKQATFKSLCKTLPYAKESISQALRRLATKHVIEIARGCCGEFWRLSDVALQKPIDGLTSRSA